MERCGPDVCRSALPYFELLFQEPERSYFIILLFKVIWYFHLRISEHLFAIKSLILMTTPSRKYLLYYRLEHLAFPLLILRMLFNHMQLIDAYTHSEGRSAFWSQLQIKKPCSQKEEAFLTNLSEWHQYQKLTYFAMYNTHFFFLPKFVREK